MHATLRIFVLCPYQNQKRFRQQTTNSTRQLQIRIVIIELEVERKKEVFIMTSLDEYNLKNTTDTAIEMIMLSTNGTAATATISNTTSNRIFVAISTIATTTAATIDATTTSPSSISSWLSTGRIQIVLYATILLLAIIGNALVILTLIQNRRMRTITNVFLLNLAISDILLGVLCMPITLIGTLLRDFVFGEVMCKLLPYLQGINLYISVALLFCYYINKNKESLKREIFAVFTKIIIYLFILYSHVEEQIIH